MDSDDSHGIPSDEGNVVTDGPGEAYFYTRMRGSKSFCQNIRKEAQSRLLHLGKTLLSYNTYESHKYALEIALIFLNSIPSDENIPDDLFTYIVSIFHMHYNEDYTDKLFKKFLTLVGANSPILRPIVLEHYVRLLAANKDTSGIVDEVTRRCNEWNLQIHEVAKHYKWVVKHMETLTNFEIKNVSPDFIFELEDVLATYLDHRRLPNKNLINLYTNLCGYKALELLNKYILLFPKIYFLRFNRLKILLSNVNESNNKTIAEDLVKFVRFSGYSSMSVEFLNCFKEHVPLDDLVLLLCDLVVNIPYQKTTWELLYSTLNENSESVSYHFIILFIFLVIEILDKIKKSEFINIFNIHGNIGRRITMESVESYLNVASLFVSEEHLNSLKLQFYYY